MLRKIKFSPVFKQFLAVVCCHLLTLSLGCVAGWATINFIDLQSEDSPFPTGPLTLEKLSLIVSLQYAGSLIGNFITVPIITTIGVKRTIHIVGLPLILSSLTIIFAQNVYYLYVARLLSGIVGGAIAVGVPTLICDISHDNVRGALNALYDLSFNVGTIISFFLGTHLSCIDQAIAQLAVPAIFMILMFFVPESPEYWTNRNKQKQAIQSHRFYKGSIAVESAEFLTKVFDERSERNLKTIDEDNDPNSKLSIKDFLTPQAKRAIFISFTSVLLSFCTGTLVILNYVTEIFAKTGSSLSAKNSSLLISVVQISSNLIFLNIVERVNRRVLYTWASFLTSASFFLFAAYCQLWIGRPDLEWVPPFCFSCIIYFNCMGMLPIPYIITTEIFPKKIRATCIAISTSVTWIILFILGALFPVFMESFGLSTCMITLGVVSLLNAVFGILYLPETRGKSYDEIMDMLSQ